MTASTEHALKRSCPPPPLYCHDDGQTDTKHFSYEHAFGVCVCVVVGDATCAALFVLSFRVGK